MIDLILTARLSNRMRALESAIALSECSGRALTVYWMLNRWCNCSFERLFLHPKGARVVNVDVMRLRFGSVVTRGQLALRRYLRSYDLILRNPDVLEARRDNQIVPLIKSHRRVLLMTGHRVFDDPTHRHQLAINPEIMRRVEVEAAALPPAYISVHVRRTDHEIAIANSPLELFVEKMQSLLAQDDHTFFLATDDPAVEVALMHRFPGRITTYRKTFGRDSPEAVCDALVDLLLLSRGSLLLASYWSSFSKTAAMRGDIPFQVVTVDANEQGGVSPR